MLISGQKKLNLAAKLIQSQLLAVAFFIIVLHYSTAVALLKVGVNEGNAEPMPIAIDSFDGQTWEEKDIGREIHDVIVNDLQGSGLFRAIDRAAFLERPSMSQRPNLSNWRKINATVLVVGSVSITGDYAKVQFKVWDPYAEKQIEGIEYKFGRSMWRKYAHRIADVVYNKLTGESGYFDTKILFVSESGPAYKKVKKLSIMDQDGANYRVLTDGKSIVITPRFDSKSRHAIYVGYYGKRTHIYMLNLATGVQRLVGHLPGIAFAPRFSPDDSHVIFSIAMNGSTSIYEMNLYTGYVRRLTGDIGTISTSPCYSPDGKHITFSSDMNGKPQIYVMNRDGSNVMKISQGAGSYNTPVWSPRGDFIAFTKKEEGTFYIGVMRMDGSGERLLTTSWMDEGPTWSPNGRVIMFTRQKPNGASNLYAIDLTGYNERLMSTPMYASDPSWSSLLH
ncbi:MAG: Tol-Pal system beta propeller repeat protein TolB [Candidatus Lariskella arthropodorum]|uniref:Tol-Pal system beta propeller repeat protein TolB n=1 Tax=Candidatus Lariskella endosymbiont of Epinotia ramella TaxID=3066224 RepID=UPI0030CEAAB3